MSSPFSNVNQIVDSPLGRALDDLPFVTESFGGRLLAKDCRGMTAAERRHLARALLQQMMEEIGVRRKKIPVVVENFANRDMRSFKLTGEGICRSQKWWNTGCLPDITDIEKLWGLQTLESAANEFNHGLPPVVTIEPRNVYYGSNRVDHFFDEIAEDWYCLESNCGYNGDGNDNEKALEIIESCLERQVTETEVGSLIGSKVTNDTYLNGPIFWITTQWTNLAEHYLRLVEELPQAVETWHCTVCAWNNLCLPDTSFYALEKRERPRLIIAEYLVGEKPTRRRKVVFVGGPSAIMIKRILIVLVNGSLDRCRWDREEYCFV